MSAAQEASLRAVTNRAVFEQLNTPAQAAVSDAVAQIDHALSRTALLMSVFVAIAIHDAATACYLEYKVIWPARLDLMKVRC